MVHGLQFYFFYRPLPRWLLCCSSLCISGLICGVCFLIVPHLFFWPRGYKTFFMLNLAEHENFSANKYENANISWHFHIY